MAHEVAQQLESRECSTLGVILIDSPCPLNHQPLPKPVIDYILSPISKSEPTGGISMIADQFSHHARFLSEYHPDTQIDKERTYIMLQSVECFETTRLCGVKYPWLEDADARSESLRNWERVLGRQLSVLEIPGNHFEPFKPDNVSLQHCFKLTIIRNRYHKSSLLEFLPLHSLVWADSFPSNLGDHCNSKTSTGLSNYLAICSQQNLSAVTRAGILSIRTFKFRELVGCIVSITGAYLFLLFLFEIRFL